MESGVAQISEPLYHKVAQNWSKVVGGPTEQINIRTLHPGSKSKDKANSRNRGLWDPDMFMWSLGPYSSKSPELHSYHVPKKAYLDSPNPSYPDVTHNNCHWLPRLFVHAMGTYDSLSWNPSIPMLHQIQHRAHRTDQRPTQGPRGRPSEPWKQP